MLTADIEGFTVATGYQWLGDRVNFREFRPRETTFYERMYLGLGGGEVFDSDDFSTGGVNILNFQIST